MKYDVELESWMQTFYASLTPEQQRRYAAVEALKANGDEEGQAYIVELLGCDAGDIDQARQEFASGDIVASPEETVSLDSDGEAATDFAGVAGVGTEAAEGDGEEVAAFWQADDDAGNAGDFSMAPAEDVAAPTSFEGEADEGDGGVALQSSTLSKSRRKKKGPSALTNVIGIVVFGVVGLAAGYGILVAFFPEKDAKMLNVRQRWSDFMNPEETADTDSGKPRPTGIPTPGSALDPNESDPNDYVRDRNPNRGNGRNNPEPVDPFGPTPVDPVDPEPVDPFEPIDPFDPNVDPTDPTDPEDPFDIEIPDPIDPTIDPTVEPGPPRIARAGSFGSAVAADDLISEVEQMAADTAATKLYLKLCDIAHELPGIEDDPVAVAGRGDRVHSLLSRFLSEDGKKALSKYSYQMLLSGKRPSSVKGVVLYGTVGDTTEVDGGYETTVQIETPEGYEDVYVVSPEDLSLGGQAVILGTIVTDPANELENYGGDKKTLVLSGWAKSL